jgi:hypothetical protein
MHLRCGGGIKDAAHTPSLRCARGSPFGLRVYPFTDMGVHACVFGRKCVRLRRRVFPCAERPCRRFLFPLLQKARANIIVHPKEDDIVI